MSWTETPSVPTVGRPGFAGFPESAVLDGREDASTSILHGGA